MILPGPPPWATPEMVDAVRARFESEPELREFAEIELSDFGGGLQWMSERPAKEVRDFLKSFVDEGV